MGGYAFLCMATGAVTVSIQSMRVGNHGWERDMHG